MKRTKRHVSAVTSDGKEDEHEGSSSRSAGEFAPGSLIWVKLEGDTWWPAQVVDESSVSETNKPNERLPKEVLVRLYGSYQYLYVDPNTWRSELDSVLKKMKGTTHELFQKSLEKEIASSTDGKLKGRGSKARAKTGAQKQDKGKKKLKASVEEVDKDKEPSSVKPEVLSTRRLRVMQSLGLVGPSGSPFKKSDGILSELLI